MMAIIDLIPWNSWLLLGAGLACTLLVLRFGRTAVAARPRGHKLRGEEKTEGDPFRTEGATERRASLRRRGRELKVLVATEQANATAVEGLVLDWSTGGLCLALPQEVPVGAVLSVRASAAPVTTPWVQAEVRYSRAQASTWEHGCALVDSPNWGVLLQFG